MKTHFTRLNAHSWQALGIIIVMASISAGCGDEALEPSYGFDAPVATHNAASVCREGKAYSDLSATADSYTLLSVMRPEGKFAEIKLINMDGIEIKSWPLHGFPGQMLPGGSVIGHIKHVNGKTDAPGVGGVVQFTWDGKQEWSSREWQSKNNALIFERQHHDMVLSPSPVSYFSPGKKPSYDGNILILSAENTKAPTVSDKIIIDDLIREYTPDGSMTAFRWKASEHIDEMGFSAVDRAAIKENPNLDPVHNTGDWIHLNAMSVLGKNHWYETYGDERFHPDNILISSRQANLMAIISRETGKIVWRVGPDFSKGKPEHGLGQIVGQHHAHLIPSGLPGAGNVLLYDNGGIAGYGENKAIRTYSRVLEFNPMTLEKVWEYKGADIKGGIFSMLFGSVQRLPNGNTLVTVGMDGLVMEVSPSGKKLWQHIIGPDEDGSTAYLYRAYRVPPEWLPAGVNPDNYTAWNKRFTCPE